MRCDDCAGADFQGLLGMNVLSNFVHTVDPTAGVLRLEDRRARTDQRLDIAPFVTLEATPEASSGPGQPFVISAASRAPRTVMTLFAHINLLNAQQQVVSAQDVQLPSLPAGQRVSLRIEVPRQPPFTYFQVEIGEARW